LRREQTGRISAGPEGTVYYQKTQPRLLAGLSSSDF
jgi:hypothetical protein